MHFFLFMVFCSFFRHEVAMHRLWQLTKIVAQSIQNLWQELELLDSVDFGFSRKIYFKSVKVREWWEWAKILDLTFFRFVFQLSYKCTHKLKCMYFHFILYVHYIINLPYHLMNGELSIVLDTALIPDFCFIFILVSLENDE